MSIPASRSDATIGGAARQLMFRAATTAGLSMAYSTLVLGNPVSNAVIMNAAGLAGSAAGAEMVVRYVAPHVIPAKATGTNSLLFIGAEAALAGAIYSQAYPRFIFPGSTADAQQLLMVGAGLDFAAQQIGPQIATMMEGGSIYR